MELERLPNKSQDKQSFWDGHIFKIGVCIEKTYDWIGLNNISRRFLLECPIILTGTSIGADGSLMEVLYFDEDNSSNIYRKYVPHNMM